MRFPASLFTVGALAVLAGGCAEDPDPTDYKALMREFVIRISEYGRERIPGFIVIPQNGPELLTESGEEHGPPAAHYLAAINGVGREDLFYGFEEDDEPTPPDELAYMLFFTDLAEHEAVQVLTADYCSTSSRVDDSYRRNEERGYTSFAADSRELDRIPNHPAAPWNVNARDIETLEGAANFLYLLAPDDAYADRAEYLGALTATGYDILILDAFYRGVLLSPNELSTLKRKNNGGTRLVIAYMSIGEAEDYRDYWKEEWRRSRPSWLAGENPDWPGNYKVRYWDPAWQAIILGGPEAYLDRILAAGFDGVYLDIVDGFEYFESAAEWWQPF